MAPAFTAQKMRMAAKLFAARKRANFSQERAANAVGTSRRHWIRWEHGETMPNPAYLERIAAVLDAPEVLTDDEVEEVAPLTPIAQGLAEMFEQALERALEAKLAERQQVA